MLPRDSVAAHLQRDLRRAVGGAIRHGHATAAAHQRSDDRSCGAARAEHQRPRASGHVWPKRQRRTGDVRVVDAPCAIRLADHRVGRATVAGRATNVPPALSRPAQRALLVRNGHAQAATIEPRRVDQLRERLRERVRLVRHRQRDVHAVDVGASHGGVVNMRAARVAHGPADHAIHGGRRGDAAVMIDVVQLGERALAGGRLRAALQGGEGRGCAQLPRQHARQQARLTRGQHDPLIRRLAPPQMIEHT